MLAPPRQQLPLDTHLIKELALEVLRGNAVDLLVGEILASQHLYAVAYCIKLTPDEVVRHLMGR
jgi:hypothetical protein